MKKSRQSIYEFRKTRKTGFCLKDTIQKVITI